MEIIEWETPVSLTGKLSALKGGMYINIMYLV